MEERNKGSGYERAISGKRVRRPRRAVLAVLLAFTAGHPALSAAADELSLLFSGKAVHMDAPANNVLGEQKWGLGLQYDWNRFSKHWIPFGTVAGFRDSSGSMSYYAGGGIMQRFRIDRARLDLGAVGFLMTRKGQGNDEPFLGVLPAASVGNGKVALNVTYVPRVDHQDVPFWYVQLKINLGSFR